MKINFNRKRNAGLLTVEMIVGMAILVLAFFPLALCINKEQKFLRGCYTRAVAAEIVDGEMEVLLAGEWKSFREGAQNYSPQAFAKTNLPAGKFQLTISNKRLRLEWLPEKKDHGGKVVREANAK